MNTYTSSARFELNDRVEVRVYADTSSMQRGAVGVGVCLVGQGQCRIFSQTLPEMVFPRNAALEEMRALRFAVACAKEYVAELELSSAPARILVFSDVDHVQGLLSRAVDIGSDALLGVLNDITTQLDCFNHQVRPIEMHIEYIEQRYRKSPFYRTAHYTARWAAQNSVQR